MSTVRLRSMSTALTAPPSVNGQVEVALAHFPGSGADSDN